MVSEGEHYGWKGPKGSWEQLGKRSQHFAVSQTCHTKPRLWIQFEVCVFSRASVTKYPTLWGLNTRNVLAHHSGGWKFELSSCRLVPSESCGDEPAPGFSPNFWWVGGHLWCSLACSHIRLISVFLFTSCSPWAHLCVPISPL